ncbi:hypothetical protein CEE37_04360 [candidate division LCP-89 bacterium B3_LCP]|uniref:Biopolymer transporter Tol n=1 Tax=candidate division LCP-89 bacterium B3_LCP TaxID=2012998 RepID=A0A532V482_UNCL8|nr:MAG: hypothetical protein CEE37_04360 [candidate division LCP-89 bacterium B3_LCP]
MKPLPQNRYYHFSILLFAAFALIYAKTGNAQPASYNHPELDWEVYESVHFQVMFHQGTERTARELLRIAEDIYEPITSLYGYHPDTKVRIIVRDDDDYSNGGAYYYDNKILIYAKSLNFVLRGTHNWLRNVLTHEFTHIIQLGASRKAPRWLPAFYFQWIEYEEEKRPDVLYGYPNILASYPMPMTVIPKWYAEGCAQYMQPGMGYDHWDSHRDMIVRMRTLEGKLLTYTQLGDYYDKSSYYGESVYDHGFSLVSYIVDRWGVGVLKELSNEMAKPFSMTFDGALKRELGINGNELHRQWSTYLKETYLSRTEAIRANRAEGKLIEEGSFANLNPEWSKDGKRLAFTSNKGGHYFGSANLVIYDRETEETLKIQDKISSQLSWSPDGRFIFYDKQFRPDKNGSHFDDIAAWDFDEEKELRLTEGRRAAQVDVSPDGKHLCYVVYADGTENLWTADLCEDWWKKDLNECITAEKALTHHNNGEQIYTPKWSPDGKRIIYSTSRDRDRDIVYIDIESAETRSVLNSRSDERDPEWSSDGEFYFSSDKTGIFNLYRYSFTDSSVTPVSNVLGGAFTPAYSNDGRLAYADFRATGYKMALFDSVTIVVAETMTYIPDYNETLPGVNYPTSYPLEADSKPYKPSFDKTFIYPRLAMDFGTFKPGLYFFFQDVLERMTAFGGFAMNAEGDYDLFALLDYKRLHPTLFLEAYNIKRHSEQSFEDPFVIVGESGTGPDAVPIYDHYSIKYNFNLIELDAGIKLKFLDDIQIKLAGILSRYRTKLYLDDGMAFGYTYFKGVAAELDVTADLRPRGRYQDINPTAGYFIKAKVAREFNNFIDGFQINADKGTLQEVYSYYGYNRYQLVVDRYLQSPLAKEHGITLTADLGYIDKPVDDFFNMYAGGFDGMRGYSYYSLGGTHKAILRCAYNFPLWQDIDERLGIIRLEQMYFKIYGDVGNAWNGDFDADDLKKDMGVALKLQLFSYTTFPTAVTFDASYGFDHFQVVDYSGIHKYGGEWRYYFTLLFNFNLRHAFQPYQYRSR